MKKQKQGRNSDTMYRMGYLSTIFLALALGLALPSQAWAASASSILVDIIPENPAPHEETGIILNSYANNLDSVLISWSLNGKSVASGIGQKSFSVTAPAAGSESIILAKISLPDGEVEKRIIIRPNVMVLLWQASDSYVPPFYRGKALPSLDSEIKVVAMPEVKTATGSVDSKNMTYSWKKDYTNMAEDSGYGKNFFVYTNDYLENSNNVGVVATTLDQKYSLEANIEIGATEPKILFYKNDSILGMLWDKALADPHKIQASEVVAAIPYFISPKELEHPNLIWNWFINDSPVNIMGFKKNAIPLQTQSGVSGTSRLKLQIENSDKIFQTASKEMNIEF